MAEHGRKLLRNVYCVPSDRIAVIPHGIPDFPYVEPDIAKRKFGLEGRRVLLTFGLLSHDKGIGHMIDALPAIVAAEPSTLYVILGATHPNLLASDGETLRRSLERRIDTLGMQDHVRWVNDFVAAETLVDYLQAADIYVTPYLNPMQVTSGTLSYATGLGKPVVSTPYVHAKELLARTGGALVPFADSGALADAVITISCDDGLRHKMAMRAYNVGRTMIWDSYAQNVLKRFRASGAVVDEPIQRPSLAQRQASHYHTAA